MGRLDGKIALVTGGGRGIGRAIAKALAADGARVAISGRTIGELEKTAQELNQGPGNADRVRPLRMDVTKLAEIRGAMSEIVRAWGAIQILVNNAGLGGLTPIDDEDDRRWQAIIDTNLRGMYWVTREALKVMPAPVAKYGDTQNIGHTQNDHGGGRIINNASVLAKFGVAGYTAYCASKHGVIGFTRALALELAPRGITVNAVCPGWVDTAMAREGIQAQADRLGIAPEQFVEQALGAVPIKRFITPDEVAGLVCYLASPSAGGITGQAINLCGGQTGA